MKSYVYILFNKKNGTLYTGITSDLKKRLYQHKNKIYEGFTSKYDVTKLGYYEVLTCKLFGLLRLRLAMTIQ